jgi:TusA-related sulfurtransferase
MMSGQDKVVDARGNYCPMPLMKLVEAMKEVDIGRTVEVWSSDSGSQRDISRWAEKMGHEVVAVNHEQGYDRIKVRRRK